MCQNVYQLFWTLSHQGDYENAASEYKQVSVKLVLSSSNIVYCLYFLQPLNSQHIYSGCLDVDDVSTKSLCRGISCTKSSSLIAMQFSFLAD